MWAAGQCTEEGLSGPVWAEGLVYGGRLQIGRGQNKQKTSSVSESDTGTRTSTPSTPLLRRRPCFLKFPQQGSVRVCCPHNPANSPALHARNTEIFKAPTLKRKVNSCSTAASKSFVFVLWRLVSPLTLLFSKLVAFSTYRISVRAAQLPLQQLTFAVRLLSKCQAR